MTEQRRQAARAILIDEHGRLVLLRRSRPGESPYWTAPGGGVEPTDESLEAALHRELAEELGADATRACEVFRLETPPGGSGPVQHFFVARLATMDESTRHGPEFSDPSRGGYDVVRVSVRGNDLAAIDLKPIELKEFILANRDSLLANAGVGE